MVISSMTRLLVFCENCGGLAATLEFQNEQDMRAAFADVQQLPDSQGVKVYYHDDVPTFVVVKPYDGQTHMGGSPGWCHDAGVPDQRPIYHRCSPKLVAVGSSTNAILFAPASLIAIGDHG